MLKDQTFAMEVWFVDSVIYWFFWWTRFNNSSFVNVYVLLQCWHVMDVPSLQFAISSNSEDGISDKAFRHLSFEQIHLYKTSFCPNTFTSSWANNLARFCSNGRLKSSSSVIVSARTDRSSKDSMFLSIYSIIYSV